MPRSAAATKPPRNSLLHTQTRRQPIAAWCVCLLAAAFPIALEAKPVPAESPATLPIVEVQRLDNEQPFTYEINLLAPEAWRNGQVRLALLQKAAMIAKGQGGQCFTIERASLDRNVTYVPLRRGRMTISSSDSVREWRRYWQLYQHVLDAPGIHLGLGRHQRAGEEVVEARMKIRLCPSDMISPGKAFQIDKLLSP